MRLACAWRSLNYEVPAAERVNERAMLGAICIINEMRDLRREARPIVLRVLPPETPKKAEASCTANIRRSSGV